jgi:hypothetical protein
MRIDVICSHRFQTRVESDHDSQNTEFGARIGAPESLRRPKEFGLAKGRMRAYLDCNVLAAA